MSVIFKPKILVVGPCEVGNVVLNIDCYDYDCRLGKVTFPILLQKRLNHAVENTGPPRALGKIIIHFY